MKFPEATVDIDQINQKYHAIVQEARIAAEMAARVGKDGKQGRKKQKRQT